MVVEPPEPGTAGATDPGAGPELGRWVGRGTVVVDVANVVGSRPDGWWRDRPGATTRLLGGLARLEARAGTVGPAAPSAHRWHVVLEGAVRDLPVPTPLVAVRAPADGDSALVSCVRALLDAGVPDILVVTADRGLVARLPQGVGLLGPLVLRDLLEPRAGQDGP